MHYCPLFQKYLLNEYTFLKVVPIIKALSFESMPKPSLIGNHRDDHAKHHSLQIDLWSDQC